MRLVPSVALGLLAGAILLWSRPGTARARLTVVGGHAVGVRGRRRWTDSRLVLPMGFAAALGALVGVLCGWPRGVPIGCAVAGVAWLGARRVVGRSTSADRTHDQFGLAAGWDLLAACLRSGMPVPTAVLAVVDQLPRDVGQALRATADLLALGADPVAAWAPALAHPATAELARGARRTARSGTALAGVAAGLAANIRRSASDAAEARAQRAGVLITGPLGLCFLPAFVCLGILPVVAGLATQLSIHT
jgi:Flp pilus assembly protein TadB